LAVWKLPVASVSDSPRWTWSPNVVPHAKNGVTPSLPKARLTGSAKPPPSAASPGTCAHVAPPSVERHAPKLSIAPGSSTCCAPATISRLPSAARAMAGEPKPIQSLAIACAGPTFPSASMTVCRRSSCTSCPGVLRCEATCSFPSGVRTSPTWSMFTPFADVTGFH
jgi:hypothetical protein